MKLPSKLKNDTISEVLFEVRFESDESQQLPEAVITKLSDFIHWRDFELIRSPISDIPFAVRVMDPNLKRQPSLEMHSPGRQKIVKIGTHSLSYHRLKPYPGWDAFRPEIIEILNYTFSLFRNFRATRLGLRYVNMFTPDHNIGRIADLNFALQVASKTFDGPINVNYMVNDTDHQRALIRIASPEFFSATHPNGIGVVDIDVFTRDNENIRNSSDAIAWFDAAHELEKREFFNLFTEQMKSHLVES